MAKSKNTREIVVFASSHHYPIYIGAKLLQEKELIHSLVRGKQALVVSNETVAPLYLHCVKEALQDKQCDFAILPDGEKFKNQESVNQIYELLLSRGHHRDTTIIALGGGVIGDMAAFAASTYQRGVNLVQIPTTLLAQVDASVGGKTGINHPLGKNMIGSFYQPLAVIIDPLSLRTLSVREFSAGLAEIIKYGLLAGEDLFNDVYLFLQKNTGSECTLEELIFQCCQIKADFVKQDEREQGARALLNLGHTVAHGLETLTGYQRWLHGEAVAIGLYCAALLSHRRGLIDESLVNRIDSILQLANLPRRIPNDIDLQQLLFFMYKDKKIKNNHLRFILIRALGDCYMDDKISESEIEQVLKQAQQGE